MDNDSILGMRNGKLEVIEMLPREEGKPKMVLCRCDCGTIWESRYKNVKSKKIKSCGCSRARDTSGIIGRTFGRWTVIGSSKKNLSNKKYWKCKCTCGTIKDVLEHSLYNGISKSCGCASRVRKLGERFGKLVVVEVPDEKDKHNNQLVICKCDCGNIRKTSWNSLTSNRTKSCGCLHGKGNITHGMTDTRIYKIWQKVKDRCRNPDNPDYRCYGGRGIAVCDEWCENFEDFAEWSFANGYTDTLTIDRIDNDGDYEPQNCRWVDRVIQARNRNPLASSKSGHSGVTFNKQANKWHSHIGVNNKSIHLGFYDSLDDAILARESGELKYWGDLR